MYFVQKAAEGCHISKKLHTTELRGFSTQSVHRTADSKRHTSRKHTGVSMATSLVADAWDQCSLKLHRQWFELAIESQS